MRTMSGSNVTKSILVTKWLRSLFILLTVFTITTVALAAATLAIVIKLSNSNKTEPITKNTSISLVDQIKIGDLMKHLERLQVIADRNDGTRAIATKGFNSTLNYITSQLEQYTSLTVQHKYFTVRNYIVRGTPELSSDINGNKTTHIYSKDFAQIMFSAAANFESSIPIVAIPNFGCRDTDWMNASVAGLVALVLRGNCTYTEKSALAEKHKVKGLLIYNHGSAPDGSQVLQGVRNNLNTTIPAYFISYDLGMKLLNSIANATVVMRIDVTDANGIGNICADTKTGDKTKTIVVGSHSDGVPAGSGINDNGKACFLYRHNDNLLIIFIR